MNISRRSVLRAGVVSTLPLSLSGCLFGSSSSCSSIILEMNGPLTDAQLGRRFSTSPDRLSPAGEEFVRAAADDGAVSYATAADVPVPNGTVFELSGTYYRAVVEQQGAGTQVTGYEYEVSTTAEIRRSATSDETIAVSELPAGDRMTIRADSLAKRVEPDRQVEGEIHAQLLFAYGDQAARDASVFVPEPQYRYLRYGDTAFEVRLATTRPVTVIPYRIRLSTETDSAAEYGRQLVSKTDQRIEPDSLSTEGREFVTTAIEEGSASACVPWPDHVDEVLAKFGLEPDESRTRTIKYGSDWYTASTSRSFN